MVSLARHRRAAVLPTLTALFSRRPPDVHQRPRVERRGCIDCGRRSFDRVLGHVAGEVAVVAVEGPPGSRIGGRGHVRPRIRRRNRFEAGNGVLSSPGLLRDLRAGRGVRKARVESGRRRALQHGDSQFSTADSLTLRRSRAARSLRATTASPSRSSPALASAEGARRRRAPLITWRSSRPSLTTRGESPPARGRAARCSLWRSALGRGLLLDRREQQEAAVDDRCGDVAEPWPLCWEWLRSISKALSASIPWRAIRIPFACSITARRPNAPCRLWYSLKRCRVMSIALCSSSGVVSTM